jgi:hydroxymethylpyrimidine pyrophosphatase-like HAD family hydrolase
VTTRMVVTDLDGTLLDRHSRLADADRAALEALGRQGVPRVVATGRSLYSARRVLDPGFPIDYLAFSTGAGILDWASGEILLAHGLESEEVRLAVRVLSERRLDFMVHEGIPDNHRFLWRAAGGGCADFERRRGRHEDHARPLVGDWPQERRASQLLAVEPDGGDSCPDELCAALGGLSVILATSPLDHASRWLEIFAPGVSKSAASAWLARRHGVDPRAVWAVGNDYNDRDLLAWAGRPRVVANAVPELRALYPMVAAHDEGGFAEAVAELL